ncbi:MAG TPA: SRPBCC family protein [Actinomycetota bacterium]|nr:SRPBCC family protein [Actinomycetota bacterium]
MKTIERSVEVDVPVRTAYNQWTQFEEFPRFMGGVESVAQITDSQLHWVAEIGGKRKEWDARITEQVPDQVIAWEGFGDPDNRGRVFFEPADGGERTRVSVAVDYEPEGALEKTGDALGMVERRVRNDLERFKQFIETRGSETGAWRGEIHEPPVG